MSAWLDTESGRRGSLYVNKVNALIANRKRKYSSNSVIWILIIPRDDASPQSRDHCRLVAYLFGVCNPTAAHNFNSAEQAQDSANENQGEFSQFLQLANDPAGMGGKLAAGLQSRQKDDINEVLRANLLAAYSKAVLLALRLTKGKAKRVGHSSIIAGMPDT